MRDPHQKVIKIEDNIIARLFIVMNDTPMKRNELEDIHSNLLQEIKKTVTEKKEIMQTAFFSGNISLFDRLITSLDDQFDQCMASSTEKNISLLLTVTLYLVEQYTSCITTNHISKLIDTMSSIILHKHNINEALLLSFFENIKKIVALVDKNTLSKCNLSLNSGYRRLHTMILCSGNIQKKKIIFENFLDSINTIIEAQESSKNKYKQDLNIDHLHQAISLLNQIAFIKDNSENTTKVIKLISSLSNIKLSENPGQYEKPVIMRLHEKSISMLIAIISKMVSGHLPSTDIKIISTFTVNYLNFCIKNTLIREIMLVCNPTLDAQLKIENNLLFTLASGLFNSHSKGNTDNAETIISLMTEILNKFQPKAVFQSSIMTLSPKIIYASEFAGVAFVEKEEIEYSNTHCLSKLFEISQYHSAKNNKLFTTFLFEKLLDKFNGLDKCDRELAFTIFKDNQQYYADALHFYLSTTSPEKLKNLLTSDTLLSSIIKLKPLLSSKSNLQTALETVQHCQKNGLYKTRCILHAMLCTEIKRLRSKTFLGVTDIEASNILVDTKKSLKISSLEKKEGALEIELNMDIAKLGKIEKRDKETTLLLFTIQFIQSWYLQEHKKERESLMSLDSITVEQKKEVEKNKSTDTSETKPVSINLKPTAVSRYHLDFFQRDTSMSEVEMLQVPNLHPSISELRAPSGPIEKKDIIEELFGLPASLPLT